MCDICSVLKIDKPFRFHRTDDSTSPVLVGKKANKYSKELENHIFSNECKDGRCFTAVVGEPGSGKTHLLYHLLNESKWRPDIRYAIYELKDKEVNLKVLEDYIKKVIMDDKSEKKNARLCLLVDTVDEYLRNISRKHNSNKDDAINSFLTVFSQLVDANPGSCIVFAITKDVYEDFKKVLEHSSFQDRFTFIKDGSEDLILEMMNEDETYEMVAAFLKNWKKRNNISYKKIKECSIGKFDLFPFTPEAVRLFWKAGVVPGDTSLGCTLAINDKLKQNNDDQDKTHLIIKNSDAARIITHFSSYFRGYEIDNNFKLEVKNLIETDRILEDITKIEIKSKQQHFDYSDYIVDAFGFIIKSFDSGFSIKNGDIRKFVKDKYQINEEFKSIDLVLTYESVKIGIQFVSCNQKESPRRIVNCIDALSVALRNNDINRGILFSIYENESDLEVTNDIIKRRMNSTKRHEDYLPDGSLVDYREMINYKSFSTDVAWQIVGIFEMFSSLTGSLEVKKYLNIIESKTNIVRNLKNTLNQSPQRKILSTQQPSPHLIEK
ncbi:MAG: hypothetical protein PWQ50_19 [Methanolobus sp.]|nr:hypothetical protein [Methanolobus sp.]